MTKVEKRESDLTAALGAYLPEDRLLELGGGAPVPEWSEGAVLFADVAGFTGLTTRLAQLFGPHRGAEEVPVYLNRLYEALIGEVHARGGVVIGFAGDGVTCWFADDDGRRAAGCAAAMQDAMSPFASVDLVGAPVATSIRLELKVAVTRGAVRRFRVGEPQLQLLDLVAGEPVARLEALLGAAPAGGVAMSSDVAAAARSGRPPAASSAAGEASRGAPDVAELRRWLLPTVQRRLEAGGGDFLTELRPVAALFLSFAGLDFVTDEEAGRKLDHLVRAAQRVTSEYGGNVLQLTTGDKGSYLYAAYGAPVSHEDDAERCAAAALDLRAALQGLDFVREFSIGLGYGTARTGAYGSAARRTYGALGEGTNMAARLMSKAPQGRIYASAAFVRALGGAYELGTVEGLSIKGKAAPVTAFELITSAAPAGGAGATRRRPAEAQRGALVGRASELRLIREALEAAARGRGAVVQIVAEAGMGKSELLRHALGGAPSVRTVVGVCQAFGRTAPYQLWKGVYRQLLGVGRSSTAEGREEALVAALAAIDGGLTAQAGLLAPLLDLPAPEPEGGGPKEAEERSAARRALALTLFRQAARSTYEEGRTLVLVLEDLHWLDPASAEYLQEVGRAVPQLPVLLLTTSRPPELGEGGPSGSVEGAREVRLSALDDAAARRLVAVRLAGELRLGALDDRLVAAIVERSGGNPFYLGELLTDLLERVQQAGDSDLEGDLVSELPSTLQSLILGRLDRLEHEQVLCLKVASVVGRRFRTAWVGGALGGADVADVEGALRATGRVGLTQLVTPEPEAHAFNHAITREVTYESQPHATRARLHARLARFIERSVATPTEPRLDLLAYHYALGDDAAKARHYLSAAGAAAKAAYANEAALDYYGKLLALQAGAERLPTLLEMGEVMTFVGAYGPAEERLAEAVRLAREAGDRLSEAGALRLVGELHERQGNHGRARTELEAAAGICRELAGGHARAPAPDSAAGAELTRVLLALGGNVLWHLGAYDEAAALLGEAVELARAAGDTRAAARALHGVANIHLYRGEAAAAERAFQESLAMRREAGDDYGVANSLNNLAILAANAGDDAGAERLFGESLEIRQRLGDVSGVAVALNNLGYMVASRGDLTAARRLYERSLASRRELGDRLGMAVSLNNLAGLVLRQGAREEAGELYLRSVELAASIDNPREAAAALAGLASSGAGGEGAGRMLLVAELLLRRLGAAVEGEVSEALERARESATPARLPPRLADAPLTALVNWALGAP